MGCWLTTPDDLEFSQIHHTENTHNISLAGHLLDVQRNSFTYLLIQFLWKSMESAPLTLIEARRALSLQVRWLWFPSKILKAGCHSIIAITLVYFLCPDILPTISYTGFSDNWGANWRSEWQLSASGSPLCGNPGKESFGLFLNEVCVCLTRWKAPGDCDQLLPGDLTTVWPHDRSWWNSRKQEA